MVLSNFGMVAPVPGQIWLRIHTSVLGGIAQVVFGTLPGFVAARVGAPPPGRATQRGLWGALNVSILLVCGAALAPGRPGQPENRMIARFYATAAFYLFLGILMALTMKLGWPPAPARPVGAREAHIHANAWGFLNLVIAISLFKRLPQVVGRPLAFSRLNGWTWWGLASGGLLLIGIELAAVQSLISGWALQIAMAALPGVLPRLQAGEPAPCAGRRHPLALWAALVQARGFSVRCSTS